MKTTKILSIIFGTLIFFAVVLSVFANPRILYLPFTDLEVFLKHGWYYDEQETDEHKGIDYFKGQSGNWQEFEILAVAGGVAEYRPNGSPTWGNYVVIDHQTGSPSYYTVYAHLESSPLPAYTPTAVNEGDLIGIAGATGFTDPPGTVHLHLEWSKDGIGQFGTKLDPYGIKKYYTYYPGYPNFIDCGIDLQNPGVFWWTECPPVPPGGGGDDPLPVINVSGTISEDTTWEAGYVYLIQGEVLINPSVTLTLEPGVIVKFYDQNSVLTVDFDDYNGGHLIAQGTDTEKIYFTSYKDDTVGGDTNNDGFNSFPSPADYQGVALLYNSSAEISNVVFRYGGYNFTYKGYHFSWSGALKIIYSDNVNIDSSVFEYNESGVYIYGGAPYNFLVLNTLIDNNGSYGIYVEQEEIYEERTLLISNSIISNHNYGIYVKNTSNWAHDIYFYIENTSFINNQIFDGYLIGDIGFTSYGNTTSGTGGNGFYINIYLPWKSDGYFWDRGVPIIIGFVGNEISQLTINPGSVIKFFDGGSMWITYRGSLIANGTAQNRIHFTSYKDDTVGGDSNGDGNATSPAPSNWRGIAVCSGASADISQAVIRYGGNYGWGACGPIYYGALRIGGAVAISDTLITKNNYGIYQNSGTTTITQSSIKENTSYGIYHTGTGTTTATSNWWGDASGPYHPQNNPNGQGDRVSNNVEFSSWLIEDPFWKQFIFPKK